MAVTAYVAMGSNLGDRAEYLQRALQALRAQPHITIVRLSTFYETAPVGGPAGQNCYLNAVVALDTALPPRTLLQVLQDIEQQLGRVRQQRWGPRTIDLDLLLYGDEIIRETDLQVPHPYLHLRSFVLEPLAEIAAAVIHPTLGVAIGTLWDNFPREAQPEPPPAQTLRGLRAVVTGSTGGIGKAIALALAAAGASVIIHGRREAAARQTRQECQALGAATSVVLADLQYPEECRRLAETAWQTWQGLDIWINNAGTDVLTGTASKQSFTEKLHSLWQVDVAAAMQLSREVGQRMREQGHGVLLNMGWDQTDTGMEGDSGQLFGATKGAVMAFSKSLAVSLAPQVRVNCLAPGWIRTAWGEQASDYWQERVRRETPLQRWGTPEDVAAVACWLASPAAAFLTGQIVRINGGVVR